VDAAEHAMLHANATGDPDLLLCVAVGHSAQETRVGLELAQRTTRAREAVATTAASVHVSPAPVEADHGYAVGALALYGNPALRVVHGRADAAAEKGDAVALFMDPAVSLPHAKGAWWDPARTAGIRAANAEGAAGVVHHGYGTVDLVALHPHMPACEVVLASGVSALGQPMRVTRVAGSMVMELDGQPALARVLEQLPQRARLDPARALARCLVGISAQQAPVAPEDPAALMARPLVGLEEQSGGLAVGDNPPQGAWLQLVKRDAAHAERALQRALVDVKFRLRGSAPVCALYFTCRERGRALFGRPHVEIQRIHRALGAVPVLGMAGGLQVGPQGTGQVGFHMLSGVLMVLAQGN
jgi:hypothetical protein